MLIESPKLQKKGKEIILSAKVTFNSGKSNEIFFSLDSKYADFVKNDASPFLACLLLPAMKLGENIRVDGVISAKLLENTKKIMNKVVSWDIGLKKIKVTTKGTTKDGIESKNVASFFSGGVDSFATYLRNKSIAKNKINYFLLIHGFDIFIDDESAFTKVYENVKIIAKSENVELIAVKTNLRETIDPILGWGLSHGGALASIALLLSNGLSRVYIASTYSIGHLFPWGSHPELDYMWSIENLEIIHDSSHLSRQQKIKLYIAKSPVALEYLRVCWSNYEYNCARCSKCIRTMLALHITNSLHNSKTFPTEINTEQVKKLYLTNKSEIIFFEELLSQIKKRKEDKKIQEAIEYVFKISKHPNMKIKVRNIVSFLDKKYNNDRLFWYLAKKGMTTL